MPRLFVFLLLVSCSLASNGLEHREGWVSDQRLMALVDYQHELSIPCTPPETTASPENSDDDSPAARAKATNHTLTLGTVARFTRFVATQYRAAHLPRAPPDRA